MFTSTFGCPFTSPLIRPICDSIVRNAVTVAVTGSSTKWLRVSLAACTFRCSRAIVGECYRPFHESFVSFVLRKNLSNNRFQHSPNCCCRRVYVLRCQVPLLTRRSQLSVRRPTYDVDVCRHAMVMVSGVYTITPSPRAVLIVFDAGIWNVSAVSRAVTKGRFGR